MNKLPGAARGIREDRRPARLRHRVGRIGAALAWARVAAAVLIFHMMAGAAAAAPWATPDAATAPSATHDECIPMLRDEVAPILLRVSMEFDPVSGRILARLDEDKIASIACDAGSVLLIELEGPCADPRLGRTHLSQQRMLLERWQDGSTSEGAHEGQGDASSRYLDEFMASLATALDRIAAIHPSLPLTVGTLPLVAGSDMHRSINEHLKPLTPDSRCWSRHGGSCLGQARTWRPPPLSTLCDLDSRTRTVVR